MGIIFAFVLASQIHTGEDLVAACRQTDTRACIAIVRKTEGALARCLKRRTDADIVAAVLKNADAIWYASAAPNHELTNSDLSASAAAELAISDHLCRH